MPEGTLANKRPVNTLEELKAILADTGGRKYYAELAELDVDVEKLAADLEAACQSRIKTWLSICARCGMCAESCLFYLCSDKDPEQVPAYKILTTLGEMLKRKGRVDNAFMRRAMDFAWSRCTCCNRCSQFCPHGIDTGVMFSVLRGLLFSQGFVPWEMKIGSGMHRVYGAQMDVSEEEFAETCSWMEEETADDWPGLEIPVEREGVEIMYTLNAREPKHYPEDIARAALLFHLAGESWTVPCSGWDQTSLSLFAGDWEACKMNVERIYAASDRLKVKRVIGTECGHAHRATVVEGPYWAGREDGKTPVEYLHYVQWLAECLRTGKLKVDPAKRIKEKVTVQDACNYVRNNGLGRYTREVLSYMVEDGCFVEMPCNTDLNFCCGGGGGLNGIGIYREQRNEALKVKCNQIAATGAKIVVAPCHNCWDAMRALEENYKIGIRWSFLKPLLIDMLIVPDHLKALQDECSK